MRTNEYYLGIDTSSVWCNLALVSNTELVASVSLRSQHGHSQALQARCEWMLEQVDVSLQNLAAIGVVNGPGSFTALRVGVAFAQGLAMGLKIPLVPVSTTDAIVAGIPPMDTQLTVLIPARKGEVFSQQFAFSAASGWTSITQIACSRLEELRQLLPAGTWLAGPGAVLYRDLLGAVLTNHVKWFDGTTPYLKAENVAWRTCHKLTDQQSSAFCPTGVSIHYRQGHGARTILERTTQQSN